jgi:signal transduction histidine kinase/Tfp pilus assembly protein PilF
MRKVILFCTVLVILFSLELKSQNTDSLIKSLDIESNDTIRIKAYIKIVKFYNSKEPIKALPFAISLIKLAKKVNNEKLLNASYNQLGITYYFLGNIDQSAELFLKVLRTYEKNNDSLGISRSLNNIGLAYQDDKAYLKSLEYFKQSLDIKLKIKDYPTLWTSYINIGLTYTSLHEYDKALKNYFQGLDAWKQLKAEKNESYADIISEIGILYQTIDSLANAEKFLNEAVVYYEKSKSSYRFARTYLNLGIVSRKNGDFVSAQNYLAKSIILINESGAFSILPDYYSELSNIEKSKGNIRNAFDYYKRGQVLKDSLNNMQNLTKMNQMQEMYRIEKHDAETVVLKKEVEIGHEKLVRTKFVTAGVISILILVLVFSIYLMRNINRWKIANTKLKDQQNIINNSYIALHKQNDELETLANELQRLNIDKDRFMAILGHDLKSPFNVLLGLSEMLAEEINNINIKEIEEIAKALNKAARNTYSLLEDILLWTRVQSGKIPFKPQKLNFTDITNDVIGLIGPAAKSKNITINHSEVANINIYADPDMIKTVLRNLVSNAIKFTNNHGIINIKSVRSDSELIISVSDNGIGITPDNLTKLFKNSEIITTKGTADETGTGLGLLLCKEFVEIHGGKIWVESEQGKGSEFKFTLPFEVS